MTLPAALSWAVLVGGLAHVGLAASPSSDGQYESMKKRVLAGDMTIDFRAFRIAGILAAGPQAGMRESGDRQAFRRLVATGDYQAALDQANRALERNYASAINHFDAMVACQSLKKPDEAALHEKVLQALLDSIQASGDGKSEATAWFVVSTPEEYIFMSRVLGVRAKKQGLVQANQHAYDQLDVAGPKSEETHQIWFNCDVDMGLYKPAAASEPAPKKNP